MDFKSLSDPVVIVGDNENKPSFLSKIRPPKTDPKKFMGAGLTVLLLFAVGIGVYVAQRPTNIVPRADEVQPSSDLRTASPSASLNPIND